MSKHQISTSMACVDIVAALQPLSAASQISGSESTVPVAPLEISPNASVAQKLFRFYSALEVHCIRYLGRPGPSDLFTDLDSQPLDDSDVPKGRTRYTAQTSRLGFEASTSLSGRPLAAKLEIDFYIHSLDKRNKPRVRQACVGYCGFLVGKTWSTFIDLDGLPETVDFNGSIDAPFSRRLMLRYPFGNSEKNLKWTFGLESPKDQFSGGSSGEKTPIFVMRLDKSLPAAPLTSV